MATDPPLLEPGGIFAPQNAFPLGQNGGTLVANFPQRGKYRNATYFQGLPKPIDTFYDKVFYGKVDRFQNVIVPKKDSSLIKQTSNEENVFAFNFVADAFFKLKRNLKIAGDSGGINTDQTILYDLQATNGWFNYDTIYKNVFKILITAHDEYLTTLSKKKFNKIVTFSDYINSLINYLKTGAYKIPISLTEYVLSISTPPNISGLVIETSGESYSADLPKYTKYFLDPNFSYYVRAARKFGFYVDKNGPWRLFADVLSAPMLEILGDYGVNKKTFFNTYYDRTYTLDLPLMKKELLIGFNNFAIENQYITETVPGLSARGTEGAEVSTVSCGPTHTSLIGLRDPITAAEIDNLGDAYWMSFYFNIRMLESGIYYKNSSALIEESIKVMSAYDYNRGLIYINNLFKPYLYDERIFKPFSLTQADAPVRIGSVSDAPTAVVGITNPNY